MYSDGASQSIGASEALRRTRCSEGFAVSARTFRWLDHPGTSGQRSVIGVFADFAPFRMSSHRSDPAPVEPSVSWRFALTSEARRWPKPAGKHPAKLELLDSASSKGGAHVKPRPRFRQALVAGTGLTS